MVHTCTIKMPSKMYYKQNMVASFMIATAEAMKIEEYIPSVSYNGTQ